MTPKQFRAARAKLGLSVNELADKLQINSRTVRRYQKDKTGRDHWPVPRTVEMSVQKLLSELHTPTSVKTSYRDSHD